MLPDSQRSVLARLWKGLFVALVLASCVRVWVGPVEVLPRAQAQIPDAGTQRKQALREARETNRLLGEILHTLQKGTLNVRQASTDKNGDGNAGRQPAGPRR